MRAPSILRNFGNAACPRGDLAQPKERLWQSSNGEALVSQQPARHAPNSLLHPFMHAFRARGGSSPQFCMHALRLSVHVRWQLCARTIPGLEKTTMPRARPAKIANLAASFVKTEIDMMQPPFSNRRNCTLAHFRKAMSTGTAPGRPNIPLGMKPRRRSVRGWAPWSSCSHRSCS
jgi:hypothetical protein